MTVEGAIFSGESDRGPAIRALIAELVTTVRKALMPFNPLEVIEVARMTCLPWGSRNTVSPSPETIISTEGGPTRTELIALIAACSSAETLDVESSAPNQYIEQSGGNRLGIGEALSDVLPVVDRILQLAHLLQTVESDPDEPLAMLAAMMRGSEVWGVTYPDTVANIERLKGRFPVAREHQEALAKLGSQYVYASECGIRSFEGCFTAFVRFSGAIETGFGLTREVLFFYSPHPDLQIRTYNAARQVLRDSRREITPDIMFFWSPDPRLREKLDDWSSGKFLPIPLDFTDDENPIAFISLLRDYIFARDLFYETTPVQGERFFGRRILLQNLRDDVRNQRVAGLFGLRKAGKTSVLSELARNMSDPNTIVILRDLESLPSPPNDPVPDLLRDLKANLLDELRSRDLRTQPLNALPREYGIADFKRAVQNVLRKLSDRDVNVVLMLDEIEYLTPSDRIDVQEGDMASVAQMLGAFRSLVQENSNFTFVLSGLTSAIVESGRLYGRPNPLFSWAKAHFLAPFERGEADDLARSVGQKMGITLEAGALASIFHEGRVAAGSRLVSGPERILWFWAH